MCRILALLFVAAYGVALALMLIGTLGLFGQETDPLGAVFLVLLGLPWNRLADLAPERWWPWLAAVAPLTNLAVLAALSRLGRGLSR